MDTTILTRDLIVGALGSILGALAITAFGQGWHFTKQRRQRSKDNLLIMQKKWSELEPSIRTEMFLVRLFSVLRDFVTGNIFAVVRGSIASLYGLGDLNYRYVNLITGCTNALAAYYFIITLIKIIVFTHFIGPLAFDKNINSQ